MPIRRVRTVVASLALALALSILLAGPRHADSHPVYDPDSCGVVRGHVVFLPDRRAAAWANLVVLGARRGAQTDENGRFVIWDVPLGKHTLRVQAVGVPGLSQEIVVAPGPNDAGVIELLDPETYVPPPIAIGSGAAVGPRELQATIVPTKSRFRVGDALQFHVRIRNRGDAPILLVQSVDGSEFGKSPRVVLDIDGPGGGFVVPPVVRCGNTNGISAADFAEVEPGDAFDPYAGGWLPSKLRHGRLAKPGRYTATFHYATTTTDARAWMEGPCTGCDLGGPLRDLLARVPAVELTATTTFEVVP